MTPNRMNRMSIAQKRAMIADYVAGVKVASIGARFGIDPTNVRAFAAKAGIPPRHNRGQRKDPSP